MAVLLAIAVWAVAIERQLYVIREDTIKILPDGSKPIRVLQIGDIHLAPWQKNKIRFLKSLGSKDFDLVVNTGDNLGHKDSIRPLLDALGSILARPGVFVHGSNDYYAPVAKNLLAYLSSSSREATFQTPTEPNLPTEQLTAGFEAAGWINLNNSSSQIEFCGTKIRFIGIDDYHIGRSEFESLTVSDQFTIALTHAPYMNALEQLTGFGAELIFAGHTHGGQVRVPLIGALTTNSDLPNKYARGVSGWEFGDRSSILSVVAGLGNSIFAPVRFLCRPEVRLVTLTSRS